MSSNSLETKDLESTSTGIISKATTFITSKKGMYLVAAIVLLGAIYYYTQNTKKTNTEHVQEQQGQEQQGQYQPPPGYVTVPVEMLQGLQQQEPVYDQVPEEQHGGELNLQTQQGREQQFEQPIVPQNNQQVPKFKHNQQLDEDEDEEIQEQNLSKLEMESIQAQLNNMQQQRGNPNNA